MFLRFPTSGESTLTADYVEMVANATSGDISTVDKVVVPVEFTAYESGAIQAIIDNFQSVVTISIGYTSGDYIDYVLNSYIVGKIEDVTPIGTTTTAVAATADAEPI